MTRGVRAALLAAALLGAAAPAAAGPSRYVIVPFENLSTERSLNWIGEAIAMSLSDRFELLGMRTVSRGERVDALEGINLPAGASLSLASQIRLAGALRASRLVTGTYTFDPKNGVVVSAKLVDVAAGSLLWEASRPGTLAGIFTLMEPICLEAASRDPSRVSPASPSALGSVSDPPLPLYEIIVKGVQEADPDKRVSALEKGLTMNAKAPSLLRALAFALHDAGRDADASARLDQIPDGALPDMWRLHLLRARILLGRGDADGAIASLGRSVSAGESAEAHLLLARILAGRGDRARAQAELDLAAGLEPDHPEIGEVRAILSGKAL